MLGHQIARDHPSQTIVSSTSSAYVDAHHKVLVECAGQEKEIFTAQCPQAHSFLADMRLDWWPYPQACKLNGKMDPPGIVVTKNVSRWNFTRVNLVLDDLH